MYKLISVCILWKIRSLWQCGEECNLTLSAKNGTAWAKPEAKIKLARGKQPPVVSAWRLVNDDLAHFGAATL